VREGELASCGYTVLTSSPDAGVDLFVKQKKKSLFVHFQGHPEYGAQTLLKEYRRDIKRFLRAERTTYPSMPQGYFSPYATHGMSKFRELAISQRTEETMSSFPENDALAGLHPTWHPSSRSVYRNWLQFLLMKKAESPTLISMSRSGRAPSRVADSERA
jgi:homoserine O-succinyltransferase